MEINSKNNNLIKTVKKQKTKNRFLLFLDTPKLIEEAIKNNLTLKYLFVEKGKKFDFAKKFESDIIYVDSQILKSLSDVKTNAGALGVFDYPKKEYSNPETNYLVLDNVQDAGNVGTLIRSAVGANFKTIYLLDCASVTNSKVIRSTMGALFKASIFEMSKQEFLQTFDKNNLYSADMNGKNIYTAQITAPVGVAIGNEGKGVSKEILNISKGVLSLPMQNNLESLNAAVSGSILMYEINFGGKNVRTQ